LPESKRKSPRVQIHLVVQIEAEGASARALAVNVGLGGMFIAGWPLAYGQLVHIVAQLPGLAEPARLPAIVRWANGEGYGVQFLQLGAQVTHALSQLVSQAAA